MICPKVVTFIVSSTVAKLYVVNAKMECGSFRRNVTECASPTATQLRVKSAPALNFINLCM